MTSRKRKLFWIVPAAIAGLALFIFIGGEIVMRLWNWLLPALFGWKQIGFWQAVGLLALCRILFGSHGFRHGSRSEARRRIKDRINERWAQMTPEEREKYRQSWSGRCGYVPPEDPAGQP
jgi:hypothetical protein